MSCLLVLLASEAGEWKEKEITPCGFGLRCVKNMDKEP